MSESDYEVDDSLPAQKFMSPLRKATPAYVIVGSNLVDQSSIIVNDDDIQNEIKSAQPMNRRAPSKSVYQEAMMSKRVMHKQRSAMIQPEVSEKTKYSTSRESYSVLNQPVLKVQRSYKEFPIS